VKQFNNSVPCLSVAFIMLHIDNTSQNVVTGIYVGVKWLSNHNLAMFWLVCLCQKCFKGKITVLKMLWIAFLKLLMYPKSQQSQNVLTSMSMAMLKGKCRHNILQCCNWYFIGYSSTV